MTQLDNEIRIVVAGLAATYKRSRVNPEFALFQVDLLNDLLIEAKANRDIARNRQYDNLKDQLN